MRYSKQRELVLQKVEQLCDHPTAEEIFDLAAKECPGLSLGTVYRNLNSLVDAGRVRRVSIPGKARPLRPHSAGTATSTATAAVASWTLTWTKSR